MIIRKNRQNSFWQKGERFEMKGFLLKRSYASRDRFSGSVSPQTWAVSGKMKQIIRHGVNARPGRLGGTADCRLICRFENQTDPYQRFSRGVTARPSRRDRVCSGCGAKHSSRGLAPPQRSSINADKGVTRVSREYGNVTQRQMLKTKHALPFLSSQYLHPESKANNFFMPPFCDRDIANLW